MASPTAGERKHLTIMFADLAGSTALCQGLSPEQVHDLINGWVQAITEEIYRCGGVVTEFAGDAVMALFGAPVAYEDSPQRACRAGLAMQRRLRQFNAQRSLPLQMRIGIDSGESFVGAVGGERRSDYTALGHRANLAKRVQEVAELGSVTVSDDTHRLVAPYFRSVDAGEFAAKGLSHPLRLWRIIGETPGRTRLDVTLARWRTDVVGRREPLARLRAQLDFLQQGRAGLVTIEGEAGIGKSRLALELKGMAGAAGVSVWGGRALPHGEQHAYGIFADLIGRSCGVESADSAAAIRDKLRILPELGPDAPFLEAMLGVEDEAPLRHLDSEARKAGTFATVARLVRARAAAAPLLVLLDDFHWADPLSRELTEFLVMGLGNARVLLCLMTRPDGAALACAARFEKIEIASLSPVETAAMVSALVHLPASDTSRDARDWIHRVTGGNPLFVEEVLQALIAEGVLVKEDFGWRLSGDVRQVFIPAALQDLIAARVDRLPPETKAVLQHAAVIGDEFDVGLLEAASDVAGAGRLAADLAAGDFIVEAEAPAGPAYRFKHGLTREVAYAALPRAHSALIHERVGLALEANRRDNVESVCSLLAHHFARSANATKAVFYLERAGEQAQRAHANEEAVSYFSQALERGEGFAAPSGRRSLLLARGEIRAKMLGDHAGAVADFEAALEAADAASSAADAARALLGKGDAFIFQHRFEEGVGWIDRALARADAGGCARERVQALLRKGFALGEKGIALGQRDEGAPVEAHACLVEALRISRELADRHLEIQALIGLGTAHLNQLDYGAAQVAFEEAAERCREVGDQASLGFALQSLGRAYQFQGDFERARRVIVILQRLLAEIGDKRRLAFSYFNLAGACAGLDREEEAIDHCEEAVRRFRELGIVYSLKRGLALLRALYGSAGRSEKQIEVLEEMVPLLSGAEEAAERAEAQAELGKLHLAADGAERAEAALAAAAKAFIDAGDLRQAITCLELAAEAKARR